MNTATGKQSVKSSSDRRKRVNQIKTAIVILVIVLMLLPTICCIILGIQVSRLQNQMDDLVRLHSEYGLLQEDTGNSKYAYAAETEHVNGSNSVTDIMNDASQITISEDQLSASEEQVNTSEDQIDSIINNKKNWKDATETENQESGEEDASATKKNREKDETKSTEKGLYAGKKVYLTFDDGPSVYTDDILDILEDYDVKATFFVVGKTDDESKHLYQRIVDEGHTLGMHSYSHVYSKIYNSLEDFDYDFTKLWNLLYDTTGYKPTIYRFPGGSDNLVSANGMEDYIRYLNDHSITYFDWNVLNGDATGVDYTDKQLISNVLDGITGKRTSIVLMHDSQSKKATVDSLPDLIETLIAEDAEILPLDENVSPIQMIEANTIK